MSTVVALVGRPNSGKSTLYNALTGGEARVGNFPGITVDVLESRVSLPDGRTARVVDLPGVYSVEAAIDPSSDEGHARRFLDALAANGEQAVIAQVLDSTQLPLGLRLTEELVRRQTPLVVLATQHDMLERLGAELDAAALTEALGVPVLRVSAREPQLKSRVLSFLADATRTRALPPKRPIDIQALVRQVKRPLAEAEARATAAQDATSRLDRWLLHPVLAPVFFLGLMAALFAAVFMVADPVTTVLDAAIGWLSSVIEGALGPGLFTSLLVDGILGGAGTVLAFLPQIVVLTMAMELIDASGYLARGTFLVDRLLHFAGLSGKAFVPLLTAHACAVPAIHSTRIIRDPGQRLRTILVLPLMTCSARIPTFALLLGTFFAGASALTKGVMFVGLYFAGVASGLVASLVLGRTVKPTARALPLVQEMPPYRRPSMATVLRLGWSAARRFLRDVGTVIVVVSVVLWALLTIPAPGGAERAAASAPPGAEERVVRMHGSVAAAAGQALEPLTSLAGFDWRMNVGLIASFGARELMVGTLGVIFGIEDGGDDTAPLSERLREAKLASGAPAYGVPTGLALMAFFILACQCMSTVAAVRRETRSWRWPAFLLAYTYAAAFVVSVVVFQGARALGL